MERDHAAPTNKDLSLARRIRYMDGAARRDRKFGFVFRSVLFGSLMIVTAVVYYALDYLPPLISFPLLGAGALLITLGLAYHHHIANTL